MAKGSFYRYATDKEDVVEQILEPVIGEVTAALDRCEQALRTGRRDDIAAIYLVLARELSQVVARHTRHVLLYLQEARAPQTAAPPAIQRLADDRVAQWQALFDDSLALFARQAPVIEIKAPAFCAFRDMKHFDELLVLG